MLFFVLVLSMVGMQRLVELSIAKRNERWMRQAGAYEVGAGHYPFIVLMHSFFFISLLAEVLYFKRDLANWGVLLLALFLLLQLIRVWTLLSLGKFWNTKIIVLPGASVIKKGPYKYMRHPNYMVVALELLLLPLAFQAYLTALIFTLLNIAVMALRIPLEEKALQQATNYEQEFKAKSRFYPSS